MKAVIVVILAALLLLAPLALNTASAAPESVTAILTTDPFFVMDHNCNGGPRAAYVGFEVKSTTTGTFNVNLQSLSTSLGFDLAGGQAPTQVLPLTAGVEDYVYFYVRFNCTVASQEGTFQLTITEVGNPANTFSQPFVHRTYPTISADAGGLIVSTSSQQSDEYFVFDVRYGFGATSRGNPNSNPPVPGDFINMQPAGNVDFRADCLQLVDTVITFSQVNQIANIPANAPTTSYIWNDLYFGPANENQNSPGGTGNNVIVKYYFKPTGAPNCGPTVLYPYAAQTSGSTNRKYTGNFGNIVLAVDLAYFRATVKGSNVLVEWETVSELDNLGFNIYREDVVGGGMIQINPILIPSTASGSSSGASYLYVDENVADGVYDYWLESVDVNGVREMSGPANVRVGVPTAVTLGSIEVQRTSPMLPFALAGMAGALVALAVWRRR